MAIAERAQPVVAAAYPAPGSSRRGRLRRLDGASDDDESAEAFDPQYDVEPNSAAATVAASVPRLLELVRDRYGRNHQGCPVIGESG